MEGETKKTGQENVATAKKNDETILNVLLEIRDILEGMWETKTTAKPEIKMYAPKNKKKEVKPIKK
jgi:hypothetical protein